MRYIPATPGDVEAMLGAIGINSLEELFHVIPEQYRLDRLLNLPRALSEWEVRRHMEGMAAKSIGLNHASFLGGGAYAHFAPSVVDALISRTEFMTAYTPYQPEVSQGTLQAIFEFQTQVCELFGMDVANASMYEAGSALAEACLMADRMVRRKKSHRLLMSQGVNPQYRATVKTYLAASDLELVEIPIGSDGATDLDALQEEAASGALGIIVQTPNYLGVIEALHVFQSAAESSGAIFITAVAEPVAMGLLEPPGAFGADIVIGEGQTFGLPLSFGGPYAGMFATRKKHVRSIPGRLVGQTVDSDGETGYVLTLSTREQHIRRDKATSNICTNQGLYALAASIFMALLGKQGLQALAARNLSKAEYLKKAVAGVRGLELPFSGPTFNEFVVRSKNRSVSEVLDVLEKAQILGGIPLGTDYPELDDCFLVAVTEMTEKEAMDRFVDAVEVQA